MHYLLLLILSTLTLSAQADEVFFLRCQYDHCGMTGREIREEEEIIRRGDRPQQRQQCQQQQNDFPQYGTQRAFHLTVRGEINGRVTLKYINGNTFYKQPPVMSQQQAGQQYGQQQFVTEESDLNFSSLVEVEQYILKEFCNRKWSSGLSRAK